jgi:hypothetical protein
VTARSHVPNSCRRLTIDGVPKFALLCPFAVSLCVSELPLALPFIQKSTLKWYELDTCPFLYVRKKGKESAPDEKGRRSSRTLRCHWQSRQSSSSHRPIERPCFVDERSIHDAQRSDQHRKKSDNPPVRFSRPKNDSSSMKARPAVREMRHNHWMVLRIDHMPLWMYPAAGPRRLYDNTVTESRTGDR